MARKSGTEVHEDGSYTYRSGNLCDLSQTFDSDGKLVEKSYIDRSFGTTARVTVDGDGHVINVQQMEEDEADEDDEDDGD